MSRFILKHPPTLVIAKKLGKKLNFYCSKMFLSDLEKIFFHPKKCQNIWKNFMLFIYGWVNMMRSVTQIMGGETHTLCHSQHSGLFGMVVWVDLGQLV